MILAAILTISFKSFAAEGATTDKTVQGVVYDLASNRLSGAQVTVEIWGGYWPDRTVLRSTQSTVTDSMGYYEVTVNSNYWDPHNTISVTATYGVSQETRNVEANGEQYQTVDVSISLAVPEFGGTLGLAATAVACMVSVTVILSRRRRHLDPGPGRDENPPVPGFD